MSRPENETQKDMWEIALIAQTYVTIKIHIKECN